MATTTCQPLQEQSILWGGQPMIRLHAPTPLLETELTAQPQRGCGGRKVSCFAPWRSCAVSPLSSPALEQLVRQVNQVLQVQVPGLPGSL